MVESELGVLEQIFRLSHQGAEVSFDARFAPIYVTQFRGSATLESAQWLDQTAAPIFAQAIANKKPVFYIVDAQGMRSPPATVRRYWAETIESKRAQMSQMLGTIVVLDNAVLRGALTAINWLTGRGNAVGYVGTLPEAVAEGNRLLIERGFPPADLDGTRYELPSRTAAR